LENLSQSLEDFVKVVAAHTHGVNVTFSFRESNIREPTVAELRSCA
jgi:hypothetical protein